jgi:hypothetical protein
VQKSPNFITTRGPKGIEVENVFSNTSAPIRLPTLYNTLALIAHESARSIASAFCGRTDETVAPSELPPPVPHSPIALRHYAQAPYDPYAGASVPQ